jgi:hypothetical protein
LDQPWQILCTQENYRIEVSSQARLTQQAGGDTADDHTALIKPFQQPLERSQGFE